MWKKRWMGAALCMALVAGVLSGCGKQEDETPPEIQQEVQRGKYVAAEMALPQPGNEWIVKQMYMLDGELHLLMAAQEGEVTILREWKQQGDEFSDVSQEWLSSLQLPCQTWVDMKLMQDESGTQYLFVRLVGETGYYECKLWRGNGSEAEEITPEKWSVPDETWGIYESIQGIAVLENGTLTAASSTSIDTINGEDGSVLQSENVMTNYGEVLLSDGENIYLTVLGNSGGIDEIEIRPGGKGNGAAKISFPISSMGGSSLCVGEDGTLVAAGGEGIFRYNAVTENWEKLMEGTETDFALATSWCIGLTVHGDGSVYALFQQEGGGVKLVRHYYDPDAVTEVTETLKLYTVWENTLLQQAAVMYHRAHPEVLITVEYVYALSDRYSGKAPDYDQVFQSFNTMLMGDDSPDILVMDHLDVDSYVQKGLLLDIDDVITPMEQSGELFSNMTGAYRQEDGKRYVVPLKFGFIIGVGRDITPDNMQSLEALADYLEDKTDSYMGSLTVSELVDRFYPYFCSDIVKDKALDREALSKILECLKVIAENSGIVDSHGDGGKYSIWDLPSKAKLAYDDCTGFYDSMFPISMMEYVNGDFTAYENSFIPSMLTGISVKSEYQKTAKDFLRFALTKDIQGSESYGEFPINQNAFEQQAAADHSEMAAATMIVTADGGEEMFEILPYSEEITQRIVELCRKLDRPVAEDAKIREELIAALPGYLDGSRTLKDTLDSIEGGLRMYLAE